MDDFGMRALQAQLLANPPAIRSPEERSADVALATARAVVARLAAEVRRFEASLDSERELALAFVSFGESVRLVVSAIAYNNAGLIVFRGETSDGPAELIQHVSQVSFLMVGVRKQDPEAPRKPIGFSVED